MSENMEDNSFGSEKWDYEAEQNWLGFWNLLLREDMRKNPNLYKKPKNEDENN